MGVRTESGRGALGFACLAVLVLGGCRTRPAMPDLRGLYEDLAQRSDLDRNPIIVIPGVMGSTLRQEGTERVVWGAFTGDYANPTSAEGASLIALPMGVGTPLHELRDDVRATGALDRLEFSFFGLPIGVAAYANLLFALGVGGYRDEGLSLAGAVDYGDEHFTCFQFPYDWRRDVSENAERLHAFVLEKKAYVEEQFRTRFGVERAEVRFDVVAHSMGGLLTRYFLRYGGTRLPDDGSLPEVDWAGAELVDRVILVAPPNSGSADALLNMVYGMDLGFVLPTYGPAILGTMPGVYQLLPRPELGAIVSGDDRERRLARALDAEYWIEKGWGLADPSQRRLLERLVPGPMTDEARIAVAHDHLRKCLARARQFFDALDVPASRPEEIELVLAAGDALPTPAVLAVDERGPDVWTIEEAPGDGTVLRSSALADQRLRHPAGSLRGRLESPVEWSRVMFFFEDHLGLTRDPGFIDNVLYVLLEEPRREVEVVGP